VFPEAQDQLKPDALFPAQEREKAMGGRRADDLDPSSRFQPPESSHQPPIQPMEEALETEKPLPPEVHHGEEALLPRPGQSCSRLLARVQTALEKAIHFRVEDRTGQLIRQYRCYGKGDRCVDLVLLQLQENLQKREVAVQRGLAEPVTPLGSAAVIEQVGKVAEESQDEVHRRSPGSAV
jgi:hypothetical protein